MTRVLGHHFEASSCPNSRHSKRGMPRLVLLCVLLSLDAHIPRTGRTFGSLAAFLDWQVEIGAFRTYPEGYKPPDELPSEYQSIPLNKIEDFGVHCKQVGSFSRNVSFRPAYNTLPLRMSAPGVCGRVRRLEKARQ